jgi:hypothetical protein
VAPSPVHVVMSVPLKASSSLAGVTNAIEQSTGGLTTIAIAACATGMLSTDAPLPPLATDEFIDVS